MLRSAIYVLVMHLFVLSGSGVDAAEPVQSEKPREVIADMVIESLSIQPQRVTQGEPVQFVVRIRNYGPSHAKNASVQFNVEHKVIANVPLGNLGPKQATEVAVDFIARTPGDYAVFAHLLPGPKTVEPNMRNNHADAVMKVIPQSRPEAAKAVTKEEISMPQSDHAGNSDRLTPIPKIPPPGSLSTMTDSTQKGFVVYLPDKNTSWVTQAKSGTRTIQWTVDSTVTKQDIADMDKKINISLQAAQGSGPVWNLGQNIENHLSPPYNWSKDAFQWDDAPKLENLPDGQYTVSVTTGDFKYFGTSAPFKLYTPLTAKTSVPPEKVVRSNQFDESRAKQFAKKGEPPAGQKAPVITSFKYLYFKPILSSDWLTGVDIGIEITTDRDYKFGSLSDSQLGWAYIEPNVDLFMSYAYSGGGFDPDWLLSYYSPGYSQLQYPTKLMTKGKNVVVLKLRNLQFPFHGVHTIGMKKIYIEGAKQAGVACEQWKYPRLGVYVLIKSKGPSFEQGGQTMTVKNVVVKDEKVTQGYIGGNCDKGPW